MKKTNNDRAALFVIIAMMSISVSTISQSQTLQSNFPVTNGQIFAIASFGTTVFLGGSFDYLSPYSSQGIAINTATGNSINTFPTINGEIKTVAPDGSGGFYIGGNFTEINGTARTNVARLNSDGSLNAWNPVLNGNIGAIAVSLDNNTVYVSGGFTQINSTGRNHLAALSAADGSLTSWNPGLSGGSVNALSLSTTGTIYVAGSFTPNSGAIIGDSARFRIAEISLSTGKATGWNPNVSSSFTEVITIAQSASSVYIGGDFTQVNGSVTRNYAAKISKSTGIVNATWNPNPGYFVNTMVVSGDKVFIGGKFINIGGASRAHLAVLDTTNGNALSGWIPDPNGDVKSLTISGSTLYVGGDFTALNGSARVRLASVDISSLTSVNLNSLNYGFGSFVNTLALSGTTLYAGGAFTTAGGKQRKGLAAINGTTGEILNWDPNPSSASIQSLIVSSDGNNLFVGGSFTSIGGQSRNNLAKVNIATGNADATWDPNVDGGVEKMSLSAGDTLFFYGYGFTMVNGSVSRPASIAAVKGTGTGEATAFNPDGFVPITTRYIQVSPEGSTVYLGYNSTGVNWSSQLRNYFAAFNTSDGSVTDMNPGFNPGVFCSAIVGNTIYFGGSFTSIDGSSDIQRIAKFDASGGWFNPTLVTTWNNTSATRPDNIMRAILYSNFGSEPLLYLGGGFHAIGDTARDCYAAIKESDATVQSWNVAGVGVSGTLSTRMHLSTATRKIYVADFMASILGSARSNIAAVDGGSDPLPVELFSFTAQALSNGVELVWNTATEMNNYGFEIERKQIPLNPPLQGGSRIRTADEAGGFEKLGFVEGNGTTNSPKEYSFTDSKPSAGQYVYRLKQIDRDGKFEYSQEVEFTVGTVPSEFTLMQNYPNPFNPSTTIQFAVPATGRATLRIFNTLGQEVAMLYNSEAEAGKYHQVQFNASGLATGLYFSRLEHNGKVQLKKMLLVK